jgi:hypothetical protein
MHNGTNHRRYMLYDPTVRSPVSEPWLKKLNDKIQYEWEYGSIEIVRADDLEKCFKYQQTCGMQM